MTEQPTLSEIFMSKARARIAYFTDISHAINSAEAAVDGTEHLRRYRGLEQDINTWESVSGVALDLLKGKSKESPYLNIYHGYMTEAKRIVTSNKNEGRGYAEALRLFQSEQNYRKLENYAMGYGFAAVLDHLEVERGGEIAEKDLKAAFRRLDRHINKDKNIRLGQYMSGQRDDIVREIRDIAIEARREFKAMQPAVR